MKSVLGLPGLLLTLITRGSFCTDVTDTRGSLCTDVTDSGLLITGCSVCSTAAGSILSSWPLWRVRTVPGARVRSGGRVRVCVWRGTGDEGSWNVHNSVVYIFLHYSILYYWHRHPRTDIIGLEISLPCSEMNVVDQKKILSVFSLHPCLYFHILWNKSIF